MKRRTGNLVALALAGFAVLVAATYKPFGGRGPTAGPWILDPAQSGLETGRRAANLAPDEMARFKTDERLARFFAIRHGVPKETREVWCAAFVRGLSSARQMHGRDATDGK